MNNDATRRDVRDDMLIEQEYETDMFNPPRERANSEVGSIEKRSLAAGSIGSKHNSNDHLRVREKKEKSPFGSPPSSSEFSLRKGL